MTVRPPVHNGSAQAYRQGCRCASCRRAFAHARNARRVAGTLGAELDAVRQQFDLAPAELRALGLQLYLLELSAEGVGLTQVSRTTGVSRRRLCLIRGGRVPRVTTRTAHRVYQHRIPLAKYSTVSTTPLRRRFRSLRALGYSQNFLARRFGSVVRRKRRRARVKTAVMIEQFYRVVTGTEP